MCSFNEGVTSDFLCILLKDFILQKGFDSPIYQKNKKRDLDFNNGQLLSYPTDLMYNK